MPTRSEASPGQPAQSSGGSQREMLRRTLLSMTGGRIGMSLAKSILAHRQNHSAAREHRTHAIEEPPCRMRITHPLSRRTTLPHANTTPAQSKNHLAACEYHTRAVEEPPCRMRITHPRSRRTTLPHANHPSAQSKNHLAACESPIRAVEEPPCRMRIPHPRSRRTTLPHANTTPAQSKNHLAACESPIRTGAKLFAARDSWSMHAIWKRDHDSSTTAHAPR